MTLQALSDPNPALGRFILLLPCAGLGAGPHQCPPPASWERGGGALNPSGLSSRVMMLPSPSCPCPSLLFLAQGAPGAPGIATPWHRCSTGRAARGWEGTTGHTALFPGLAVARAGLALSQVDFILQNSCAKVWAALVRVVLEGMDTWHEPGRQCQGTVLLLQRGAGTGPCHARVPSLGCWPDLQFWAWSRSVARQGEL